MKNYANQAVITLNKNTYLTLIIIFAPLLNFLGGLNIDIYAPSMPTIAHFFDTSIMVTKNTITVTLVGWMIGALIFGVLIDAVGRRAVLLPCMTVYVAACLFASVASSIHMLMLCRFIQGLSIAALSVGCRALVADTIKGPRLTIALLYTSVGYGLGPIVGPFVGGIIQHYIGWEANFIALAIVATTLLVTFFLFIHETLPHKQSLQIKLVCHRLGRVLSNKHFIVGVIILGIMQVQLMIYATLGPFIVERTLHKSVITYGNTALVVGTAYFTGSILCRFLLKFFSSDRVAITGFIIAILGVALSYSLSIFCVFNLYTLMTPIILVDMSGGILFPIVLSTNLKKFLDHVGSALAVQASLLLVITSSGVFIMSHIRVTELKQIAWILTVLVALQLFAFFGWYRHKCLE